MKKDDNKEHLVNYLNRFNVDTIENLRKLRFDTLQDMAIFVARTLTGKTTLPRRRRKG